jgi:hypothetical protein
MCGHNDRLKPSRDIRHAHVIHLQYNFCVESMVTDVGHFNDVVVCVDMAIARQTGKFTGVCVIEEETWVKLVPNPAAIRDH